jgi:voltage-gated potassium channel
MLRLPRSRRESIHESVIEGEGIGSKHIKRQFYGLGDAEGAFTELWNNHSVAVISTLVVVGYYLVGLAYYSSVEGWDAITCLYFQTVTLATVGYGDFYPTTTRGRIFTIFYIFGGIFIVGRIINDFGQSILDYAEKQRKEQKKKKIIIRHSSKHYVKKCVGPVMAILIVLFVGAIFFHKNEEWDFIKALYFCVVTTTTVGYGDTGLTKKSSRVFAIFYILSSCVIVALSLGNLVTIFLERANDQKRNAALSRKLDFQFIRELDTGGSGIDKLSFLVAMLVNQGLVDKERDVNPWLLKFDELDKRSTGVIDFDETVAELEREEQIRLEAINRQLEEALEKENVQGGLFGNINLKKILKVERESPKKTVLFAVSTESAVVGAASASSTALGDVERGEEIVNYDTEYANSERHVVSNPMRSGKGLTVMTFDDDAAL